MYMCSREIGMNLADELSKTLTLPAGRRSYLPAQMLERWWTTVLFLKKSLLFLTQCLGRVFDTTAPFAVLNTSGKLFIVGKNFSSCPEIQSYCAEIQIAVGIQDLEVFAPICLRYT